MLIGLLGTACTGLTGGVPASVPDGWTCVGKGHDIWRCENEDVEHAILTLSIRPRPLAADRGDAASTCQVPGSECDRSRIIIGHLSQAYTVFVVDGAFHYAQITSVGRSVASSEIWTLADELLPQVRFHAVEEVCQRETGKPCEVTFGPMELQPNGDPRALQ
jgi:hypothetical protein